MQLNDLYPAPGSRKNRKRVGRGNSGKGGTTAGRGQKGQKSRSGGGKGPVISLHGAWAQNIGERDTYIDFMGTKGGIRLQYGGDFTYYTAEDGALISYKPEFSKRPHFENEINAFVANVQAEKAGKWEKLPSHIDYAIKTSKIMQGIYDSSDAGHEIAF